MWDANRHLYGVKSKEAKEALKRHDKRLGEMCKGTGGNRRDGGTTVVLLGIIIRRIGQGCLRQSCTVESRLLTVRNGRIKKLEGLCKKL